MKKITFLALTMITLLSNTQAKAQSEPFIGQIAVVAFNFAPNGWMKCEGQLLQINQHGALFALLGTQYGGNGQTTFALPDLRGRVIAGTGSGPGLSPRSIGETVGTENNTLTVAQLPAHSHSVAAVTTEGNQNSPTGNLPADTKLLDKEYSNATANTTMKSTMIGNTGNGQAVNNIQPSLVLTYIIATEGVFPSRP
jgi:microcystin-dependent protein